MPLRRRQTVYGHDLPEPRITPTGHGLALLYVGAPLLAALMLFDVIVWAIGHSAFGVCVAIWCVF